MNSHIFNSYLLFLFLFIILHTSCKKTLLSTRVEGEVRDRTTEQPVGGITVYLVQQKAEFLSGTSGAKVIATAVTDPKGLFSFKHHDDRDYLYYVETKGDNYLDDGSSYKKIIGGRKNKVILTVNPRAVLKLHLKNNSQKSLYISIPCQCEFYDIYLDTNIYLEVTGNTNVLINYKVYDPNTIVPGKINVFCPPFDTTTYNLTY